MQNLFTMATGIQKKDLSYKRLLILKRKTEKTSRSHKVSEIVRKAISEVLVKNELPLDTPFEFPINVVKVEMNSDLKIAYVYGVAHEIIDETEIILKLNMIQNIG